MSAIHRWTRSSLVGLALFGLAACDSVNRSGTEAEAPAPIVRGPVLDGAALFELSCAGCHRISPERVHDVGPNLYGLAGAAAGSRAGYAYSPAMAASELNWNNATLSAFIAATEQVLPGTWMTYHNILSSREIATLVDYILADRHEEKTQGNHGTH